MARRSVLLGAALLLPVMLAGEAVNLARTPGIKRVAVASIQSPALLSSPSPQSSASSDPSPIPIVETPPLPSPTVAPVAPSPFPPSPLPTPSPSPACPSRDHPDLGLEIGLAYDIDRQQAVYFGDYGIDAEDNHTWTWSGAGWKQASPPVSPPSRHFPAMAYDPARHQTLLWGGFNGINPSYNDTWTWDGTTWVQLHPTHSPPANGVLIGMDFDPVTRHEVLVLRYSGSGSWRTSTWTWDGIDWTDVGSPQSPVARTFAGFAYDGVTRSMILSGGLSADSTGAPMNDTWSYKDGAWTQLHPSLSLNGYVDGAAFDPVNNRLVATSNQHSWTWDGTTWAARPDIPFAPSNRPPSQTPPLFDASLGSIVEWNPSYQGMCPHPVSTTQYRWDGHAWTARVTS